MLTDSPVISQIASLFILASMIELDSQENYAAHITAYLIRKASAKKQARLWQNTAKTWSNLLGLGMIVAIIYSYD